MDSAGGLALVVESLKEKAARASAGFGRAAASAQGARLIRGPRGHIGVPSPRPARLNSTTITQVGVTDWNFANRADERVSETILRYPPRRKITIAAFPSGTTTRFLNRTLPRRPFQLCKKALF